jgi:hypothetical protein
MAFTYLSKLSDVKQTHICAKSAVSLLLVMLVTVSCGTLIPTERVYADAAGVLKATTEHGKAAVLIRARRTGLGARDVITLAGREKMDSIVGLALGLYLEGSKGGKTKKPVEANQGKAAEAGKVVAAVGKRRGMYGTACAMAAISPHAIEICQALVDEGKGSRIEQQLAASILVHYARVTTMGPARYPIKRIDGDAGPAADADIDPAADPAAKKKPAAKNKAALKKKALAKKRANARRNAGQLIIKANKTAATALLKLLLDSKTEEVVEPALLAAAYLQVKGFQPKCDELFKHRSPAIRAAVLLYLAKTGEALTDEQVVRVFAVPAKAPQGYLKLSPLLSNYDVTTSPLCYACEAIGAAGQAKYVQHLNKAMLSRDLRVQMEAGRAMEKLASPQSVPVLLRTMKKCPWPVLIAVTGALGAIGSADAIEPLFARLADEKGRMRLDINYALGSIAGKQQGRTLDDWNLWWSSAKATFKPDAKKTAAFRAAYRVQDMNIPHLGYFYEASVFSDRVVFTLDTSASMKGEKFEDLKRNLLITFESLKKFVKFNVADFGGHVRVMIARRLVTASSARSAAIQQLEYMKLTLGTRSYDGIEAAVDLPDMDTIFFLSDGAPVASKVNSWARIVAAMHLLNRYRPVAVYAIEFKASAGNLLALRALAARFHGRSSSPEPEGG